MMPVAPTLSPDGDNFVLVLANFSHDPSHNNRLIALRKLMDGCRDKIKDLGKTQLAEGLPFKGMVICPEYFFADFKNNQRLPLTETKKETLHRLLLKMSAEYPDILLIPGTLFYEKSLDRPEFAKYKMVKSGKHTGEREGELKTGDRREKVVQKMHTALSVASSSGNTWGVETTYMDKNLDGVDVLSMNAKYKALKDGTATTFCRNRAYLLLGGTQVARYDKQYDYKESTRSQPDEMIFIPGTTNQLPEIGGLKFGIGDLFRPLERGSQDPRHRGSFSHRHLGLGIHHNDEFQSPERRLFHSRLHPSGRNQALLEPAKSRFKGFD
jgi:predicted amidohydrolase